MIPKCDRTRHSRAMGFLTPRLAPGPARPLCCGTRCLYCLHCVLVTRRQKTEAIMTEQAVMGATATEQDAPQLLADDEALVAEELLVEEVSIDGMCGVY